MHRIIALCDGNDGGDGVADLKRVYCHEPCKPQIITFSLASFRFNHLPRTMETATIFVLTIQLIALFSIAGALLLYLLCKVRGARQSPIGPQGGSVLITSADTTLGLQLCTHLAGRGCRVFAGMKDPIDSLPAKLLKGWMKMKENSDVPIVGSIVPLRLDVTREDILKEATEAMGMHLNAREKGKAEESTHWRLFNQSSLISGIMAVINTAGSVVRGRIESQDSSHWDSMFKTNVLGSLRIARAFIGLLRPTRGRLIYFGACNPGDGLVAFTASRIAVEGCVDALRSELQTYGINVVALDSHGVPAESLFKAPVPFSKSILVYKLLRNRLISDSGLSGEIGAPTQYSAEVLTLSALGVIENSLWDPRPQRTYHLAVPNSRFHAIKMTCRNSMRGGKTMRPKIIQSV